MEFWVVDIQRLEILGKISNLSGKEQLVKEEKY